MVLSLCCCSDYPLLVYIPSVGSGFVNLDDMDYVCENTNIQDFNLNSLKWMLTAFHSDNWHPLTWFSHSVDYAIWGLNPAGHHLTGVMLHALNTFLVVILAMKLIRIAKKRKKYMMSYSEDASERDSGINPLIVGMFTGLLFGLHPLHVESVAWVSERKDVLCALFFLFAILNMRRVGDGSDIPFIFYIDSCYFIDISLF